MLTITSVLPNPQIMYYGDTCLVTIGGSGIVYPPGLHLGGYVIPVVSSSATQATFSVSGIPVGNYFMKIVNGDLEEYYPGYTFQVWEAIPPPQPAPVIYSASPNPDSGGGTVITVTGANFQNGAQVRIDGVLCPTTFISSGQLSVTAPAHSPGNVTLQVTNPDGQAAAITVTYPVSVLPAPTFTSISPGSIGESGGAATITGTGFQTGATVTVCGVPATGVTVVSSTQISLTLPPYATSSVTYCPIVITNPDGQFCTGSNAVAYTDESVPAPTINGSGGISPDTGIETGGTLVTITGTGFQAGATVTFDGTSATNVVFVNSTTLRCNTPAHAPGAVDVVVTNPDTQSVTETNGFTYIAAAVNPPSISETGGVIPATGSESGGTTVTITGTDFVDGAVVYICNIAAATTFVSSTELTAVTPAHAPGACPVTVVNPDGQTDTATEVFTYTADTAAAPTINEGGISPVSGPETGGTTVTIAGTGFQAGVSVTMGGQNAPVVAVSPTSVSVISPAHAPGAVDVVVTNPDAQSVTATDGFEYLEVLPVGPDITDISPEEGVCSGGTLVMISGTGFQAGATVTICGETATVLEVHSEWILVLTPVMQEYCSGDGCDVTVTNPDGESDTVSGGFFPVKEEEMFDTCPLKRKPSQTVLTGLKVIRKKGEMTAVLPLFDSLKDALDNCLQPGDFYRMSDGHVMIVPHLNDAPEDGV